MLKIFDGLGMLFRNTVLGLSGNGKKKRRAEVGSDFIKQFNFFCERYVFLLDMYARRGSRHYAILIKQWNEDYYVSLSPCSAYPYNQNSIKNLWGISVRSVYVNQRQFQDISSTTECIRDAWTAIISCTPKKLGCSMLKRCEQVFGLVGKKMGYLALAKVFFIGE